MTKGNERASLSKRGFLNNALPDFFSKTKKIDTSDEFRINYSSFLKHIMKDESMEKSRSMPKIKYAKSAAQTSRLKQSTLLNVANRLVKKNEEAHEDSEDKNGQEELKIQYNSHKPALLNYIKFKVMKGENARTVREPCDGYKIIENAYKNIKKKKNKAPFIKKTNLEDEELLSQSQIFLSKTAKFQSPRSPNTNAKDRALIKKYVSINIKN